MKTQIFTFILSIISAACISAQPFQLKLNWKVGDKRLIHGETREKEFENGVLVKDTIEYQKMEISVLKESKNAFSINVRQENVALKTVIKFFDRVREQDLAPYKDLNLEYRMDKKTGKASLANWKESKAFILNSMKAIESYMKKKMPDEEGTVKMLFVPIKMAFNSKEEVEAYFNHAVNYLEYPYDQKVNLNDTILTMSKDANPMSPGDSLTATSKTVVKNVNKSSQQVEVWQKIIIDFEDYKKMLQKMMQGMMLSFGVPDSTQQKNAKDINEMQVDINMERVITYNYVTSWPIKLEANSRSLFQAAGKKTETYKTIIANFK